MVAKPLCPLYKNIIKPLDRARYPELRYILVLDTDIYDGLSKEWQDKLQETSDYQAQDNLSEILAVFLYIPKEKAKRSFFFDVLFALHLIGKECRSSFQEHSNALVLTIRFCAYPMLLELFKIVSHQSFSWVSDIELLSFLDLIQNNKMVLVPVKDARQWRFVKDGSRRFYTNRT